MKSRSVFMQRCYRDRRRETAILTWWTVSRITHISVSAQCRFAHLAMGVPLKLALARRCPVHGSLDVFRPAT